MIFGGIHFVFLPEQFPGYVHFISMPNKFPGVIHALFLLHAHRKNNNATDEGCRKAAEDVDWFGLSKKFLG